MWSVFVKIFLNILKGPNLLQIYNLAAPKAAYVFFTICIFSPLFEEMLFRYAPIKIAKSLKQEIIFPTILITSAIFGIVHEGLYGILQAGGAGFILSILFIKNNYSYLSSVVTHMLCNIMIMYIL